jgi:lipoprotein-anchoring transpeptidase ErfK/SrfK
LTLVAVPVLAFVVVVVITSHSGSAPAAPGPVPARSGTVPTLPPPPAPAFVIRRPSALSALRGSSEYAPVGRAVVARAAPNPGAAPTAEVSVRTPEGTTNILQLLGPARRETSGLWERVRLAVLPNGATGWVPRSALGGVVVLDTRLVVDRARFRATLTRDGVTVFTAPVGVGQGRWQTPTGTFYVRDVLTRYSSPEYGPIAFGTSARSAVLTDWPAGGYIGIHGTDEPNLIPGPISHGCIRMRNADILRLAKLMPVGTPVIIR